MRKAEVTKAIYRRCYPLSSPAFSILSRINSQVLLPLPFPLCNCKSLLRSLSHQLDHILSFSSMKSSVSLRSFNYSASAVSHLQSLLEKPGIVSIYNVGSPHIQRLTISAKPINHSTNRKGTQISCVKTPETIKAAKPNVSSDGSLPGSQEKIPERREVFPNGYEALVLEVCDETEIAELKLQVGEFEMHLKRNIGVTKAPLSGISPTMPPPIPTEPMTGATSAAPIPPLAPKASPEKASLFTNVPLEKSSKLAVLEASGSKGYVLLSSPTVGSFRRGRTVKGKKQPPICKEGDVVKEGQVIGYVDQFGTELPVKSDVAGEVLKVLFREGEAVGYGDPLMAVLPSFHGIK